MSTINTGVLSFLFEVASSVSFVFVFVIVCNHPISITVSIIRMGVLVVVLVEDVQDVVDGVRLALDPTAQLALQVVHGSG
jgi:hypothetical protein